jgi:predicted O-methyltransferase YrrM
MSVHDTGTSIALRLSMRWATLIDALTATSLDGLRLGLKDRRLARVYWSSSIQRYSELMGRGLRPKSPLRYIYAQGWAVPSPDDRVQMPLTLQTTGGTRLDELLVLATVTRVLQPSSVFEIGTFNGRTTSAFVLNAAPGARIISLDLPSEYDAERPASAHLASDVTLVKQRQVGSYLHELRLADRYEQLFGDSLRFDPAPYAGSIELGFIDAAHARRYVQNDTEKMALMMSERGLVFWHDYGGRGEFRALMDYLDDLSHRIAIYRVAGTSLAWAPAAELRALAA